jgi:protein TonB
MRKKSIAGSVTLEFTIDQSGDVRSVRVVNSTHREFEEEAVTAVKDWKFAPGEKNGRKVSVRSTQLLMFDPSDDEAPQAGRGAPPTIDLNPPPDKP